MGDKNLQKKEDNSPTKIDSIEYVNKTFQLSKTVEHLHLMMSEVTKNGFDAKSVNASCNCIQQLNNVIDSVIKASRFINEKD